MQPAPSDRAVPQIFRHGPQDDRQDQPLPSGCRSGPSPGTARSFNVYGREPVSRLSGGRECSHRLTNEDALGGSGARLRLLRPVPSHQRVQVFLRTESPRIPAADTPRLDCRRQFRSNFSNTPRRSRAITAYRCICELQRKKSMKIPTQAEIENKLRGEDLNIWLDLWRAEQGPAKPAALKLLPAAIPFPIDQSLQVFDVGCGPGDAGRAIHSRFPHARIDFVDRNEFFF